MSRRQYAQFRLGDVVIHIDLEPVPPAGYEVKVTKAEVGGPPRTLYEATVHPTAREAHDYFLTMCRKVLNDVSVMPEYEPTSVPQQVGELVSLVDVEDNNG